MLDHNAFLREKLAEQHREELLADAARQRLLKQLHQQSNQSSLLARLRQLLAFRLARESASRAKL